MSIREMSVLRKVGPDLALVLCSGRSPVVRGSRGYRGGHGRRSYWALAAVACVAAGSASAEPITVGPHDIKDAVTGKTVDLDTPLGRPITILYRDNGTLSGSAGAALSIYLGSSTDRGRWWVAEGRLCQKFFKWLEGETSCLRLRQDGRRIFWTRDDGKQGTATITATVPPKQKPTYALGGPDMSRHAQMPATLASPGSVAAAADGTSPLPSTQVALPSHAHVSPSSHGLPSSAEPPSSHVLAAAPASGWHTSDRTPAYEGDADRPVLAALTPVAPAMAAPSSATVDHARPHPPPIPRPASQPSFGHRLPAEWPDHHGLEVQKPQAAAMIGSMIQHTQFEHARHRWCHEVRDYRLLMRPHAVDAEAPELLTAWRHMAAPEHSSVPAASCIVSAPALIDVSRQIEHLN